MVVDEVVARYGASGWKTKDSARQLYDKQHRVVFVEPTSYMNLSGTPVRLISSWYRTPASGVLVVVDDMDIPFGTLRMKPFGGHGGHNGLRSIIATIGDGFPRLRVGVGRPDHESIDHVLSPFSTQERAVLPQILGAAADGVVLWIEDGLEAAMQFVNNWVLNP